MRSARQTGKIACACCALLLVAPFVSQAEDLPIETYRVQAEPILQELHTDFCWFHPRVAPMPGFGKAGQPAVKMMIQKHLVVDDFYSGMYTMRTDDLGKTWTGPTQIPNLDWYKTEAGETISVCDATPLWHTKSGKLLVIGVKLRYSAKGEQLLDEPNSQECAYAVYDPKTDVWSKWQIMSLPDAETKFYNVTPGCVQFLEQPDGSLLIPLYFNKPGNTEYITTVVRASFDGQEMKFLEHGDEISPGGWGFVEPSLIRFAGNYFLTLRHLEGAYVTTSKDGLHYKPVKKWTWDDATDLGSYNTQAHWLTHGEGLFLAYTRRGANNDHIARNRAPLFMAQVDARRLQVIKQTEQEVLPERGVMLGNFGASTINDKEAWITDAEFSFGDKPHARGADGTVWLGRVTWGPRNADSGKPKAE